MLEESKFAEAESYFRNALESASTKGPGNAERRVIALRGLGRSLARLGARPAESEAYFRESVELAELALGPDHRETIQSYFDYGFILVDAGRPAEAEQWIRRAHSAQERTLGRDHPQTLSALADVAGAVMEQARFEEAETLFRRAIDGLGKAKDVGDVDVALIENNLAYLLNKRGRYVEAEPFYRSALNRWRLQYGEAHQLVGSGYNNVASNLDDQGRTEESEPLYRKALEISIATLGDRHPQVATKLNNLAYVLTVLNRRDEALALHRRAKKIWLEAFGPDHPRVAIADGSLAAFLVGDGKHAEAEPLAANAVRITKKAYGDKHPDTAIAMQQLALIYARQERYSEALPLLLQARDINARVFGVKHSAYASAEENLAIAYNQLEDFVRSEEAAFRSIESARHARTLLAGATSLDLAKSDGGDGSVLKSQFDTYVSFAHPTFARGLGPGEAIKDRAFGAAQDLLGWSTGKEMAQAAARRSATAPGFAALIREQQDLVAAASDAEARMLTALAESGNADVGPLQREYEAAADALSKVEARLRAGFPRFDAFVRPTAITIAQTQAALAPDEGLLLAVVANGETHIFLVTRAGSWWHEHGDTDGLTGAIARLRCDVDIEACPHSLVVERRRDIFASGSDERPFDFASAHRVYQALFKPIEKKLKGIRRLYLVTSPELRTLPFSMLITSPADVRKKDLASAKWLGDRFAFTDLPSVSTLILEQELAAASPSSFVGYGAPVLEGGTSTQQAEEASRGGSVADVGRLKSLSPLPGTRVELEAMRAMFERATVKLGPEASEARLKTDSSVRDAAVITFATHALLPDPAAGIAEPGLVLTPPATPSRVDDGYLSASEVADFSLHAQWVILSACNTASPGRSRSNGLSALARSFLFAGAEALLASHWRVSDESTAVLTVETLRNWRSGRSNTRSQALQAAMRAVRTGRRADGSRIEGWTPDWAHPAAWAAFTITANRDR